MKIEEIRFQNQNKKYSILIGNNVLNILPKKIKTLCPKVRKIAIIFDGNVPSLYKKNILNKLKKYDLTNLNFWPNEKKNH